MQVQFPFIFSKVCALDLLNIKVYGVFDLMT